MGSNLREGSVFGIGNPLLDVTAHVDDAFLQKYSLPKNSAIIADVKQENMYEELIKNYDIEYTAGGATQNTMRYLQWIVGKNNLIGIFLGCVGNDYFGKIMEKKAKADGVSVKYQVDEVLNTGTCAVLLTEKGAKRSLCAYLGASSKLNREFLQRNWTLVEKARIFYTTGHILAVTPDSAMALAKHAHEWGKEFMICLAAPYVSHKYSKELLELLPYVDFIFANQEEAIAFATMKGYPSKEPKEIAKLLSKEQKMKYNNPKIPKQFKNNRTVIITQGCGPVLMVRSDSNTVQEFPVPQIPDDKIVDINGAGDAFTGGFLAMYSQDKPIEVCMKCAAYCAAECIQQVACTFPRTMNFKP